MADRAQSDASSKPRVRCRPILPFSQHHRGRCCTGCSYCAQSTDQSTPPNRTTPPTQCSRARAVSAPSSIHGSTLRFGDPYLSLALAQLTLRRPCRSTPDAPQTTVPSPLSAGTPCARYPSGVSSTRTFLFPGRISHCVCWDPTLLLPPHTTWSRARSRPARADPLEGSPSAGERTHHRHISPPLDPCA